MCLFVLTVIPGGRGTSDVTCIAEFSFIEYMRTYRKKERTIIIIQIYKLLSVTLPLTSSPPSPKRMSGVLVVPLPYKNDVLPPCKNDGVLVVPFKG